MCWYVTHHQLALLTVGRAASAYEWEKGSIIVKQVEEEEGEAGGVLQSIDEEERLSFICHLQRKTEYYFDVSVYGGMTLGLPLIERSSSP